MPAPDVAAAKIPREPRHADARWGSAFPLILQCPGRAGCDHPPGATAVADRGIALPPTRLDAISGGLPRDVARATRSRRSGTAATGRAITRHRRSTSDPAHPSDRRRSPEADPFAFYARAMLKLGRWTRSTRITPHAGRERGHDVLEQWLHDECDPDKLRPRANAAARRCDPSMLRAVGCGCSSDRLDRQPRARQPRHRAQSARR